ncbi:MAG: S1C family serine protease [Oscillospiraceae bacterium]|nr:S1C family serine protease [Oscillospiraceae bacterium]
MSEDLNNNNNNIDENNGNFIEENQNENQQENINAEISTVEEPPLIMYKKEDMPENNLYSNINPISPEDSYTKLTSHEIINEYKPENKVYKWNINDEKYHKKNIKAKKKPKNIGIKIFAALMSIMFLLSASTTAYLLIDNIYGQPDNNKENSPVSSDLSDSEFSNPVISNQDAVDESKNNNIDIEDTVITIPDGSNLNSKNLTTEEAIAKVNPSVVCIETETEIIYGRFFGRNSEPYIAHGVGTGFIVSEDGYIATNYHVVDGTDKITVMLYNGEQYEAEFIGGDEFADLAIIKIDVTNLPVAELGDSNAVSQGQDVVAIGTPAGIEFAWTATKGIISSIRDVDVNGEKIMNVIQTDASINPGNSGGPLINMRGQVVGINSMKLASTQYEGMGFAIPINIAIPVFNDIIANPGYINRYPMGSSPEDLSEVTFGVQGNTVTEEESEYYNIPQGFKIKAIFEDGPCYNSGLQLSDIIIALDGIIVTSTEDLYDLKLNYKPGDKVTLTIYRNGDTYDFDIILAAK